MHDGLLLSARRRLSSNTSAMMRYLRGARNMPPSLGIRVAAAVVIPQDGHGDGTVGILDLLALLAAWGDCPVKGECSADLNGDGTVGILDLLTLLANWGPCP